MMNRDLFNELFCILILLLIGCTSKNGQDNNGTKPAPGAVVVNDTFELRQFEHLVIPDGIYLYTVVKYNKEVDGRTTMILPRLRQPALAEIDKFLQSEIIRRLNTDTTPVTKADKLNEVYHWRETIEPVSLYKTEKIISYGFISTSSDAGAMRPFRRYFSLNYDIVNRRFIHLNDCFDVQTKKDSSWMSYIIFRAVEEDENVSPKWYDNSIDFAMDQDNFYFYFDQFSRGGNLGGMEGSVKRKFVIDHLKNEYR